MFYVPQKVPFIKEKYNKKGYFLIRYNIEQPFKTNGKAIMN